MFVQKIDPANLTAYLTALHSDKGGIHIMAKKGEQFFFKIYRLKTQAALILKQDCLSLGAEFATPKEAILFKEPYQDGILIANQKHLELLIKKCQTQPFGLKELAQTLKSYLKTPSQPLQLMGIINANEDSFYDKSRFLGENALWRIEEIIKEGAHIIDIGAASTRPGSDWVSEEEELKRIRPIAKAIQESRLFERVKFSIDTYNPSVAELCLDCGFSLINDITALKNPRMVSLAKERQCEVVIMHMQGESPRLMQQNPHYENVIETVDRFFVERIETLHESGVTQITLDVGIGFGKSVEHNLKLIRHLSHFKRFGLPLLVGASRKSLIHALSPSMTEERLPGTLILHAEAHKAGASLIRCHDVKEHAQAFKILQALESTEA